MKVKCVFRNASILPERLHSLFGTDAGKFVFEGVTIDKEYIVYAIYPMKGSIWYLICEDFYDGQSYNYPMFTPAALFEVVDDRPSKYWIKWKDVDEYDENKSVVENIGFPEMMKDPYFYGNLVEGDLKEAEVFLECKARMDNEF